MFMNPVKLIVGKNLLWLWILPAVLSWVLISAFAPSGPATFWMEAAVISACSCVCGFGLAFRNFKTPMQRFLGGVFFTGGSLWLIFSVAFLGCLPIPQPHYSPAQIEQQRIRQEASMKAWVANRIVPRDALADGTMLDLSPYYDAPLIYQNSQHIRSITPGTHEWNGIKFDIRAMIELRMQGPKGVRGIPVGQKYSGLYFLHGVEWGTSSEVVSKFVIHLTGTNTETIPMVYGRDLTGEYLGYIRGQNMMPTNLIVWQERISTNAPAQPLRGFFVSQWSNPFPDQKVETIDFVPGQNDSGAFLVAITLKPISKENQ